MQADYKAQRTQAYFIQRQKQKAQKNPQFPTE